MKIKFRKSAKHNGWDAGYWKGSGGGHGLVAAFGGSFWFCLKRMIQVAPRAIKRELL